MTRSVNVRLRNRRATVVGHVAATEENQRLKFFATVTTNRVKPSEMANFAVFFQNDSHELLNMVLFTEI